jgi:hypothetical protein
LLDVLFKGDPSGIWLFGIVRIIGDCYEEEKNKLGKETGGD